MHYPKRSDLDTEDREISQMKIKWKWMGIKSSIALALFILLLPNGKDLWKQFGENVYGSHHVRLD